LLVGGNVAQLRQRLIFVRIFAPIRSAREVGVLQRELELRPRGAAAEPHILGRLA